MQWVIQNRDPEMELSVAFDLYMGRTSWEEQNALCVAGDLPALLACLELEDHPVEREVFYTSSFHMMERDHTAAAIEIAQRYIAEFSREPFPFVAGSKPDAEILKRLALLYEYDGDLDRAIGACEVALRFGINDDGTKKGFAGRLAKLQRTKENYA